jgi:hypothetical protein
MSIAPPFPPSGMPAEHPGSPWLGGGLAPRVLSSLRRLMARLDALSPHPPLSASLGAPADQAGQGATLLTASIRFRPSGGCPAPYRPLDGMGSPEPAFFIQRLAPPQGSRFGERSGPPIHSKSQKWPATPKDREEARRITAAFRRPAGTSEQTRSSGPGRQPS